jgi:hypothetical protein
MVAPGCRPHDNVIAPSHLSPVPEMVVLEQINYRSHDSF